MPIRRDVPSFAAGDPGVPVPVINHVFAHDGDLVIATAGCTAYEAGIAFGLLILSKPPLDFVTDFAFDNRQRRNAGSLDLTASATLPDGSAQPIDPGFFGGGATAHRADYRFWVPLPDDATAAQVRLTWPSRHVDDIAQVDVWLFRQEIPGPRQGHR